MLCRTVASRTARLTSSSYAKFVGLRCVHDDYRHTRSTTSTRVFSTMATSLRASPLLPLPPLPSSLPPSPLPPWSLSSYTTVCLTITSTLLSSSSSSSSSSSMSSSHTSSSSSSTSSSSSSSSSSLSLPPPVHIHTFWPLAKRIGRRARRLIERAIRDEQTMLKRAVRRARKNGGRRRRGNSNNRRNDDDHDNWNRNNWNNRNDWRNIDWSSPRTLDLLVGSAVALNVVVFGMWQVCDHRFMQRHFSISLKNLKSGRVWTMVTSAFSQQDFMHLLVNCALIWMIGKNVAHALGAKQFATLYFGAAVTSSLSHVFYHNVVVPRQLRTELRRQGMYTGDLVRFAFDRPAIGASGAALGVVTMFGCLFPHQTVMFNLIIPMPAWMLVGGLITYDVWSMNRHANTGVSHPAHLGGAFFAVLYFLLRIRSGGRL